MHVPPDKHLAEPLAGKVTLAETMLRINNILNILFTEEVIVQVRPEIIFLKMLSNIISIQNITSEYIVANGNHAVYRLLLNELKTLVLQYFIKSINPA